MNWSLGRTECETQPLGLRVLAINSCGRCSPFVASSTRARTRRTSVRISTRSLRTAPSDRRASARWLARATWFRNNYTEQIAYAVTACSAFSERSPSTHCEPYNWEKVGFLMPLATSLSGHSSRDLQPRRQVAKIIIKALGCVLGAVGAQFLGCLLLFPSAVAFTVAVHRGREDTCHKLADGYVFGVSPCLHPIQNLQRGRDVQMTGSARPLVSHET